MTDNKIKIAFLGDSITLGYGLDDKSKRFSALLCEKLGTREENYGITGTLMSKSGPNRVEDKSFLDRIDFTKNADKLIIFGGTNDYFWSDAPIFPNHNSDAGNEYFLVAVKNLFKRALDFYSSKDILVITPYRHRGVGNIEGGSSWDDAKEHDTDMPNYNSHVIKDYVDVLIGETNNLNIPVLNMYENSDFDWKLHTMDGCHPNVEGHTFLANVLFDYIVKTNWY